MSSHALTSILSFMEKIVLLESNAELSSDGISAGRESTIHWTRTVELLLLLMVVGTLDIPKTRERLKAI